MCVCVSVCTCMCDACVIPKVSSSGLRQISIMLNRARSPLKEWGGGRTPPNEIIHRGMTGHKLTTRCPS